MADPLAVTLIARAGRLLYGEEWAAPLARALALNERTMRRIKVAAGEGAAYPVAPGALADLADRLSDRIAELDQLVDEIEAAVKIQA